MSFSHDKIELEAINIIKGLCYAQLTVRLCDEPRPKT